MEAMRYWVAIFMLLVPAVAVSSDSSGWQWIDRVRLQEMLRAGSGLWLIDIRSPGSYDAEHIEGAVNISYASLRHKRFPVNKTLVLIDDSLGQMMAKEAAGMLVKRGYRRVFILKGGVVSWRLEGYPVVTGSLSVKGVTPEELKQALSEGIPLRIFDLRPYHERRKGKIPGSVFIEGSDIRERMERLKELFKDRADSGLSGRLKSPQTVVLIFSASDDATEYTWRILRDIRGDIRYLIGGYEAFTARKTVKVKGGCPVCPEKEKR